ncbi:MAG TPA: TRAP transporter substrate-binding protein DctP [Casimicrobiaceae bacterium]|nr:TRAP transporter substrate-binding protein DctP [Casimicrobiaceae bacterium]
MVTVHGLRGNARATAGAWWLVLVFMLAPASALAADAKPAPLKVSVAVGPAFALGQAAQTWARLVNERAGDALALRVFPGATLAQRDAAREFATLRDGAADMAVGSTLFWSTQVPALAVASLPWIAPSARALDALASGAVGDRLMQAVDGAGVVALAIAPLAHRELIATTDRVHAPSDLQGLRVRIAANALLSDIYTGLGALPTTMSLAATRDAVAAGTLDAQEGTPRTFAAARAGVSGFKYVTVWQAVGELAVFAVNKKTWDGLTEPQQGIVRAAAQEAAGELGIGAAQESESALETLRERGVTITRLLPPAQAAFAAAAAPVTERWKATIGADLVEAAQAAARSALP